MIYTLKISKIQDYNGRYTHHYKIVGCDEIKYKQICVYAEFCTTKGEAEKKGTTKLVYYNTYRKNALYEDYA